MSHEIMGERFLSREHPAWHQLGVVFDKEKQITASEAVAQVAGDVDVQTFPINFTMPDGTVTPVKDQVVVVRMPTKDAPTPETFGVVGKKWHPTSYVEMARALDELSGKYQVETAGLLKDGALCFLGLKGGEWDVLGDPMESYFIVNLSLKPGEGHKVFHTPVRVVCWNTNTAAMESSTISISIQHNADAKQRLGLATNLVARFGEAMQETKETCEAFAKHQVTVEEAQRIINSAFLEPKLPKNIQTIRNALGGDEQVEMFKGKLDPKSLKIITDAEERFEKLMERSVQLRSTAQERFRAFEPTRLAGTAWAAYNAVTEVADWREGRGAALGSLMGGRAREKSRGFAEALAVVKGEESPFQKLLEKPRSN
jgi:hypothetical protein